MITGVRNNIYYQEELDFELSKNYEKEALPKIQLYCGLD
jgi:hypothetical protein